MLKYTHLKIAWVDILYINHFSRCFIAITFMYNVHVGILLTLVLIEVIGRKLTMCSELLAVMVVFLLLLVCTTQ